jgi:hypothetical protein
MKRRRGHTSRLTSVSVLVGRVDSQGSSGRTVLSSRDVSLWRVGNDVISV